MSSMYGGSVFKRRALDVEGLDECCRDIGDTTTPTTTDKAVAIKKNIDRYIGGGGWDLERVDVFEQR